MAAATAELRDLQREIAAFERLAGELEAHHNCKWVIVHGEALVGAFDTLDAAAEEAVKRFGRGPYLIRQVGAPPFVLPASVVTPSLAEPCQSSNAGSPTTP